VLERGAGSTPAGSTPSPAVPCQTKAPLGTGHEGKAYTLTGPASIGIAEAAKTIGEVSGRAVTYVDVPEETAKSAMLGAHVPGWMTDAMLELHAIDKAGYAAGLTDDLFELTGSRGTTFAEFARANAAKWRV
jgi:uncharacterized protein YbjT (DUF2867 family)